MLTFPDRNGRSATIFEDSCDGMGVSTLMSVFTTSWAKASRAITTLTLKATQAQLTPPDVEREEQL